MNLKPKRLSEMGQRQSRIPRARLSSETAITRQCTKTTALYPAILSNKPPLRVGVLLDSWMVPAWFADVLASVQHSGIAQLTTVILNREPPRENTWRERMHRALSEGSATLNTLLWRLYVGMEEWLRPHLATPFRQVDVKSLLIDAKVIAGLPILDGDSYRFSEADTAAIGRDRLAVILYFGFKNLAGNILSAPRYGIWSYHHGDNNQYRGGPAAFWEMYERNPLTGTVLQVLTEEPSRAKVIYRTFRATGSAKSLLGNRYWLYQKSIPFVVRCLRKVYEHGPAGICPETEAPAYSRRLYRTPRNREMLLFLMRAAYKLTCDLLPIHRDHWFLCIARGVAPGQQLSGRVAAVQPPPGRFWADPIIASHNGKACVFFEDYVRDSHLGRISVFEIDDSGRAGAPRTALQADHHLSYPFVFQWRDAHFMIPETASVNSVRLYRATEFPTKWEYVQDLLTNIKAVDATVREHDGHWYLFTCVSEAGGITLDELFLFVAETPFGPWAPHPMNPIVSDVRSARPGGPLYKRNGVLYRPAQNSEKSYGHSLTIFEVTALTPRQYGERVAYRIEPDWLPNIQGCHTISMANDLMVLDCKMVKWKPYAGGRSHSHPLARLRLKMCGKSFG